jgi:predicted porin
MRKIIFILVFACLPLLSFSQVFSTASTLKPGSFSLGINPVFMDNNFGLFLHGGVGIKRGLDLGLKYGFLPGNGYFGADLKWRLLSGKPTISLTTGAHQFNSFGLDAALNISFPIKGDIYMYSGIDTDINFPSGNSQMLAWIPIGVEIYLKRRVSLILEGEIPLNSEAYSIIGGGFAFYF